MKHYIDADRLKEQIQGLINLGYDKLQGNLYQVLNLIDSLQQEQPDFPTTDEEIERLLATHPKVEVPQKYKTPDWLWKKQEQPEVDLEKEIATWIPSHVKCEKDPDLKNVIIKWAGFVARHFAEWGKNNLK